MLVTLHGEPVPPQDVLKRLKQVDDRLGLKFIGEPINYWTVTLRWPEMDPRRAMIQRGEMAPGTDYDVIANFPRDCPVDEAVGMIQNNFKKHPTNNEIQHFLYKLDKLNRQAQADAMKSTNDLAEELLETNAKTLFRDEGKRVPKVFVNDKRSKIS